MGFTHENTGKLAQFVQTQETQETFENIIMRKFRPNSNKNGTRSELTAQKYGTRQNTLRTKRTEKERTL